MSILDEFLLTDRVAIVTGASSGLGVAFARALSEAGASVVLGARRVDRLEAVAIAIRAAGGRALAVGVDVADPDACTALAGMAMQEFGRIDILVNNAGLGLACPASRETPEQFQSVIDVNLNGSYWMAQACGRLMQPGSTIVNVSSILALTTAGLPQAAYSASKAGLIGLTRDLASQWTGRKGIRVNAIAPGFFPTEMTDLYDESYLKGMQSRMLIAGWAASRSARRRSSGWSAQPVGMSLARPSWSMAASPSPELADRTILAGGACQSRPAVIVASPDELGTAFQPTSTRPRNARRSDPAAPGRAYPSSTSCTCRLLDIASGVLLPEG